MKPQCEQNVREAAGRPISDKKLAAMETEVRNQMKRLAREDRQRWQSLSHEQRYMEGAQAAMAEIEAKAALKEARATMQILRTAETEARVTDNQALNKLTRSQGWIRDMEQTQSYIDAIRNEALGSLGDMLDAAQVKDGAGIMRRVGMSIFDLDNPAMTRDVIREVFKGADGHTGNAMAKAGAKAWLDTIESLRVRFNAAGGDVGKLGYGYISQAHDQLKVSTAGVDAWVNKTLPLLDRQQYVKEDGALMTEPELREMLTAAHATLASGGENKIEPGGPRGTGSRANRGSDARVLHFADGDAWLAYMGEFGQGSLYDAMMGHVGMMSRNIGLVERYGPNPEQQARVQNDISQRQDKPGSAANRSLGTTPESRWNVLSGVASAPVNSTIGLVGTAARNIQTAAKLGGAVISSLTDMGTVAATLHFNRLPYFDYLANIKKQWSPEAKKELQAHGIIAESYADALNRWTGDNLTHSWSGRVAGGVMKLSLMNAWTDATRRAFSMTLMSGMARKAGKEWGQLDKWDQYLLNRKGITEADWSVISKAIPEDVAGNQFLTAKAIRATEAEGAEQIATRWMAAMSDESQFAVINPDQATRAIVTAGGMPSGTINGELARAFFQFKAFPISMISRHWRRIGETPQGLEGAPMGYGAQTDRGATANRVAMFAAMNVSLMLLGGIVMQAKALLAGKDPMNMDPSEEHGQKFWAKALAQGGGLSFVADALLADPADGNTRTWENKLGLAGPVAGTVGGALDVGPENIRQWLQGKDTNLGPEALRWINSNTPGTSLWQIRSLWQHAVIDQAQEAMNPGYLSRMRSRSQKDWGTSWYWAPGEFVPDRAPDFATMAGE
jgi:hypothetical protein